MPVSLAAAAESRTLVIYVSAWDCTYCKYWSNNTWPSFKESQDFKQLTWRKIESPRIKAAYEDQYWPQDIRRYRDEAGVSVGLPRWIVVKDGRVVFNGKGSVKGGGLTQDYPDWASEVLPAIQKAIASS
jgi:hypothetical protein